MEKFIKLEVDNEYEDRRSLLLPNVQQVLDFKVSEYQDSLLGSMYGCESPIEQIMAMELSTSMDMFLMEYNNIELMELEPQKYIKANNKLYRVDFLMEFAFKLNGEYIDIFKLIIECDGHEFHEKTKEQVKKKNERDRDLQKEGYDILHFSGSEICNTLYKCGKEIRDYVRSKYIMSINKKTGGKDGTKKDV